MAEKQDLSYELNLRLRAYTEDIAQQAEAAAAASMKRLVKLTRETAPRSAFRTSGGHLYASISSLKRKGPLNQSVFVWYVKKPKSRITHLVENDHRARIGSIVMGRHFIRKALEQEIPRYRKEMENIVRNTQ